MISVIVVTHNSARALRRCLVTLTAAAETCPIEVIVADAQSTDSTTAVARESTLAPRLLLTGNRGFGYSANRGAELALSDLLLLLNPDTEVPRRGLERLARLCRQPGVVAVSGLLSRSDGSAEPVGEPFPSLAWYVRRRLVSPPPFRVPHVPFSVPWLSGAALLVRASAFRAVGGFREDYFLYYEDIELSRRLRAVGGTLLIDPAVRIRHAGGHSAERARRQRASDESEDQYFSSHRPRWERDVLRVVRRLLRPSPLLLGLALLCVFGVASGLVFSPSLALGLTSLALLGTLTARTPEVGAIVLLASVVPGQLVRVQLPAVGAVPLTDVFVPVVVGAWAYAVARRARVVVSTALRVSRRATNSLLSTCSLLLAALLPGLLLAAERLAPTEWVVAAGYAVRLLFILALVPLGQRVLRRPVLVGTTVAGTAVLLAIIGVLQLWVAPTTSSFLAVALPSSLLPRTLSLLAGWDPHPGRLFSTWLDPNLLGGFFVIGLAVLLAAPARSRRGGTLLAGASCAALILAVILTRSRATFFSLSSVILLGLWVLRPRRRSWAIASGVVVGVLLVPSLVSRLFSVTVADPTVALRITSWQQALEHFRRAPLFGHGYNAYGFAQLHAGNITSLDLHSRAAADNSLLTVLATMGLFGFSILLLLLTLAVWSLARHTRRRGHPQRWLPAAALLALVGLLVHSQVMNSLVYVHLAVPIALLLGAALATVHPMERPAGEGPPSPPSPHRFGERA